mmetsp:Transcript_23436/g.27666  ORF Transcript_23436/g.27666 Transcript_23436/m.27666 type:complete len:374 (+) Transcript_23436:34-1155(+)
MLCHRYFRMARASGFVPPCCSFVNRQNRKKMKSGNRTIPGMRSMMSVVVVMIVTYVVLIRLTLSSPTNNPFPIRRDEEAAGQIGQTDQTGQIDETNPKSPEVFSSDIIFKSRSAFVIPEYKLIFFTFPKVACSEWKRMFMRMDDNPQWCIIRGINAHSPKVNQIKTLEEYPTEIATAMMTSPSWTRAAFVREPKERVLSAYLDKSVKESYFDRKCCQELDDPKMTLKCVNGKRDFSSFLYFVSTFPDKCFDVHWEAQVDKIDPKWWPFINFIGYQNNLVADAKTLLQTLKSTRDTVPNRSAWERYGVTGWGATNHGCENRTRSFLEENSSSHKLNTGSHLKEWYTADTEKLVEQIWAMEWAQSTIEFPPIKLY